MSFLFRNTLIVGIAVTLWFGSAACGQQAPQVIKLQKQQDTASQAGTTAKPTHPVDLPDPADVAFEEIGPDRFNESSQAVQEKNSFVADDPAVSTQEPDTIQSGLPVSKFSTPAVNTNPVPVPPQSVDRPAAQARPNVTDKVNSWSGNSVPSQLSSPSRTSVPTHQAAARTTMIKSSPMITTEIAAPRFVNIGRKATIQIKLTNSGATLAKGVKLTATLPKHARFIGANPQPISTDGQQVSFNMAEIESGRSGMVQIELMPMAKESFDIETHVILENRQKIEVAVREPTLKLDIKGPTDTILGKWSPHQVTITNTGDGIAENIQIQPVLPSEFQSSVEPRVIRYLQPGKSATVKVSTYSETAGQYDVEYHIDSVGIQGNIATRQLRVLQPEIQIEANGPNMTFVKRSGIYSIGIDNIGEIAVTDVEVLMTLPPGIRITTVSHPAAVHPQTGQLVWKFDSIPAQSRQLIQMKGLAQATGDQICKIHVRSAETASKDLQLKTEVAARADVKINISNESGPLRAGTKTTFSIDVENRGSGIAKHVRIHAELPTSTIPVAGEDYQVNEVQNTIRYAPIELLPGEKRTLTFEAVGVDQGEHVIRSVLQLGETQRRIIAEDSIYVFETDEATITEALKSEFRR